MAISGRTRTSDEKGARIWVYPRQIDGRYNRIHVLTSAGLHAFLFFTPWIPVGGHPALNIDLPARQVWVLGHFFTASDAIFLMLLGLLSAFALFFFTSLYGRLWCGFTCPHSVFLLRWVLPIEQWIEGDRSARMKLDRGPWTFDRAWRKGAKWLLIWMVSLGLSMAFMGFFGDPWLLWTLREGSADYAVVAFLTVLWFLDLAWFREQLCNYLCPYARFQGALMDEQSLVISYKEVRGEPRGGGKVAVREGRCFDCDRCVDVCPQGIDIRDGFQLECISCGKCVDACVDVHQRTKSTFDTLVDYDTIAAAEGRQTGTGMRTVLYGGILVVLTAAGVGLLALRPPFQASVNRSPGSLYQLDDDGFVRNIFLVRLTNTKVTPASYAFTVTGLDGLEVAVAPVKLAATESRTVPLVVRIPAAGVVDRTYPITVKIDDGSGVVNIESTFKTPGAISDTGSHL